MKEVLIFIGVMLLIVAMVAGCVFLSSLLDRDEFNDGICSTCGEDLLPVERGKYHSYDLDWYCQNCHKFN